MVTDCLACGCPVETAPAVVAPFVAERMFFGHPPDVELASCPACGLAWFTPRPTDVELALFYLGYRDEHYQRQRQRHEAHYTAAFNDSLNAPRATTPFAGRVLDWGGYDGRNTPHAHERYVYDPCGAEPVRGVKAWHGEPVDLVLCCHVLEHLRDPVGELDYLRTLAPVCVEVPAKRPTRAVMHEHLTFFTPRSLELLSGGRFETTTVNGSEVIRGTVPAANLLSVGGDWTP